MLSAIQSSVDIYLCTDKVIDVGINRKSVCDFLLVINTNSYLVPFQSHRSLLFKFLTLCVFEPPFGVGRGAKGQRTMFTLGSLESTNLVLI